MPAIEERKKENLQVMIVGSGAREHCLAWKLIQSPMVDHVFVVPGNAGIALMSETEAVSTVEDIGVDGFDALVSFAERKRIGLVVVGPDSAIVGGIRDRFDEARIPCFAPSKAAAKIEGSKAYAKDFMGESGIPTAKYASFSDFEAAKDYVVAVDHRVVIKADGLAAGKGVVVPDDKEHAVRILHEILVDGTFGDSGSSVVIEEFLEGQEVSVSTFSDGNHTITLSVGQDHKRVFDDDQGPNTGGMGVYAPVPCVTREVKERIESEILAPTFEGFRKRGHPFVGLLFTGIMLTQDGPKVLEYNARFGDPETQSILPLLDPQVDLASVILACINGTLNTLTIPLSPKYACNVVVASAGYPGQYRTGDAITFDRLPAGCMIFHAGTKTFNGRILTSGGRVLTVVGIGDKLEEAVRLAYEGVQTVQFEGMFFRKDIAHRALRSSI